MKLPWDRKYLKISFHVIFTLIVIYALSLIIKNLPSATRLTFGFIGDILSAFTPLIAALVFAYIADPAVNFFQKITNRFFKRDDRKRGVIITYVAIVAAIAFVARYCVTQIGGTDIKSTADIINEHIQGFSDLIVLFYLRLEEWGVLQSIDGDAAQNFISSVTNGVTGYIMRFANSLSHTGGFIINIFIGLTLAFYLLCEKKALLKLGDEVIDTFLSRGAAERLKRFLSDANAVFSGYIGGQITDAIIMATLISVSFSVAGINYPIIIGVISGFSNLIPYLGAIVAFALSVAVGLLSGAPIKALYAAVIVLALQQLDSIVIVPKVVGKSVELHPALVLLSLSVFGGLFGLIGMVFAVPITALIKLYVSRWYKNKRQQTS